MQSLSEHDLMLSLLAIAVILIVGRGAAELARRVRQPEVLGELLGGVLLGPSVFGALLPGVYREIFLNATVSLCLSLLSWIGAILLLLIAGLEVDLPILRSNAKPGLLSAAFAIVPSIVAGTFFAWIVLGIPPPNNIFLGLVLSVTAVGVVAKLLIERDALRRGYAQVILAAGVASEVLVWLFISVVSSIKTGAALASGIRGTILVVIFFLLMMTVGKRFTYWAMRRVADLTGVVNGEFSLVLVLAFLAAALTQGLELHALLGAFVFGVLLSQAPRATETLKERIQGPTVGLFTPIFFVLAGMRVDVFKLGGASAVGIIALLFLVAAVVKVGLGSLGARLGGLRGWESLLVGIGLNLKGGTDVIVAILGAQLGLLSVRVYTLYAVVAILTVLVSPPIIARLEPRVPPSREEMERLDREEAKRRAYVPHLQRVLVPVVPELLPELAGSVVRRMVRAEEAEGEVLDVTELVVGDEQPQGDPGVVADAPESSVLEGENTLTRIGEVGTTELSVQRMVGADRLAEILEAATRFDLVAIGAERPVPGGAFTLGELQDRIIDQAREEVLVVVGDSAGDMPELRRILVSVTSFEYSMAAGDVAAYLAAAAGAELVLFTSVRSKLSSAFWRDRSHRRLLQTGYEILRKLEFRVGRLGVRTSERVVLSEEAGDAIVRELERQTYDLVVLGAVDRSSDGRLDLGNATELVLARGNTPTLLLIFHEQAKE